MTILSDDKVSHSTTQAAPYDQVALWTLKLGVAAGLGLALLGLLVSLIAGADNGFRSLLLNGLLGSLGLYVLLSAFYIVLRIIDWFEARKEKRL